MQLILGALGHPAPQDLFLFGRQLLVRIRRRHHLVRIGRQDAAKHLAVVRLPGGNRPHFDRRVPLIQTQIGFPRGAVRTVAGEARIGQDRPDVAIVLQLFLAADRLDAAAK